MISQPKKHFLFQFSQRKGKERQMLLFSPQLHELPERVTSCICFFTQLRISTKEMLHFFSKHFIVPWKRKLSLIWIWAFSHLISTSHTTSGAAVQLSKDSLMTTKEWFSLGNVEKAVLISLFLSLSCYKQVYHVKWNWAQVCKFSLG